MSDSTKSSIKSSANSGIINGSVTEQQPASILASQFSEKSRSSMISQISETVLYNNKNLLEQNDSIGSGKGASPKAERVKIIKKIVQKSAVK